MPSLYRFTLDMSHIESNANAVGGLQWVPVIVNVASFRKYPWLRH